jgi:hypothetical protein
MYCAFKESEVSSDEACINLLKRYRSGENAVRILSLNTPTIDQLTNYPYQFTVRDNDIIGTA